MFGKSAACAECRRGSFQPGRSGDQSGRELARAAVPAPATILFQLISGLQALRARTGRPHWIVLVGHHMLPQSWGHVSSILPQKLGEAILVTVHPDHVAPAVLAPIDLVLAVGEEPERTMKKFAGAVAQPLTWPPSLSFEQNKVIAWLVGGEQPPFTVEPQPCRAERIRHHRKYAEGNLRYHSFYFWWPGRPTQPAGAESLDVLPDRRGS